MTGSSDDGQARGKPADAAGATAAGGATTAGGPPAAGGPSPATPSPAGTTVQSPASAAAGAPFRSESETNGASLVPILGARTGLLVRGTRQQRIAAVAAHQRGRLSRSQLLAAGVTSAAIGRMVTSGQLLVRHRGVYVLGHGAEVALGAETDALLATGPGALLGSFAAAHLWSLVTTRRVDDRIDIVVRGRRGPNLPGVIVHRTSILTDRDIRWREGLPVTSPARTLLDLAAVLSARSLELAIDRGLVAGALRRSDLSELLRRSRGHPGHHRLAAAAAALDADRAATITDAESEELFLDIVRQAGLPPPLVGAIRHGYEIDFLWPQHGLAVEIDGRRVHGTPRAFHHDRRKDRALFAHGIVVLRYPWRDVAHRRLAVAAEVAAAMVRAAGRGAAAG